PATPSIAPAASICACRAGAPPRPCASASRVSISTSAIGTRRCAARSASILSRDRNSRERAAMNETTVNSSQTDLNRRKERVMRTQMIAWVGTASVLMLTGCTQAMAQGPGHAAMASPTAGASTMAASSGTKAAQLRAGLNNLFSEHVYLAGAATNAALGGREAEFKAAAGALDANSVAISKAIGSGYGRGAGKRFLPLWRRHIGFVVDYTVGVAGNDKAKQDKAVGDLVNYTQDFGAFLSSANPNLPKSVVADLVKHHVVTLKDVIDAQASKDPARAYTALRSAAGHMQMIADPLAEAIVKQFPDKFAG